jgi:GT2 family glycosyltransferase
VTASIAVVVLNWNGAADTIECLASLRESLAPVHVIVVDNGSKGDDVDRIRASGLADTLIETGANLGYAEGNNVGLQWALDRASHFDVVAVLNNDTVVDPGCLAALASQLDGPDGRPRAVTPAILYFDNPSETWFAGGVVDRGWPRHLQAAELKKLSEASLYATEWLVGCCIVARARTWRQVGLFDPRYYLIFEDCEWSLRARELGVDLLVHTESSIRHKVSRSFAAGPSSLLGSFYFMRNGLSFTYGHARVHLPRFMLQHLIRPTASDVLRLSLRPGLGFRWLGALAFLTGRTGRAPDWIACLAQHRISEMSRQLPGPPAGAESQPDMNIDHDHC